MRFAGLIIAALAISGCEEIPGCELSEIAGARVVTCGHAAELRLDGMAVFSGTVFNSVTGAPIEGARVSVVPAHELDYTTDEDGSFSATLPLGRYRAFISANHFSPITDTLLLAADRELTKNIALMPSSEVIVNASARWCPGAITLRATIENLGSASGETLHWAQLTGPPAVIGSPRAASTHALLSDSQPVSFQVTVTMNDGNIYSDTVTFP